VRNRGVQTGSRGEGRWYRKVLAVQGMVTTCMYVMGLNGMEVDDEGS
jgi:hypothetical protein